MPWLSGLTRFCSSVDRAAAFYPAGQVFESPQKRQSYHLTVILAHRIALAPTAKQISHFKKACGVSRFAYNWGLEQWNKQYQAWKMDKSLPKPTANSLRRQLNVVKYQEFPWMLEVTNSAPMDALTHLGSAFSRYFKKQTKRPTFHKKGRKDSFSFEGPKVKLNGNYIRVPKLGWVRMHDELRFQGHVLGAVISRTADKWYVSIKVDIPDFTYTRTKNQGIVGVDLGVKALATLSTGEVFEGPKAYRRNLWRLKHLQRLVSRKQKGSKNREKAKVKLQRQHARVANLRSNSLHQLTSYLTKTFNVIVIEDLNVKGMVRNHSLAQAISDMGFGEFRRQLEYKAKMYGCSILVADRFFPSSKTCSGCGYKYEGLALSEREWSCLHCGQVHDRDLNAAMNLAALAAKSAVTACGEESSGTEGSNTDSVKLASMKQEVSFGKHDHSVAC